MLELVNETKIRIPKKHLEALWFLLCNELKKKKLIPPHFKKTLVLVFLTKAKAKKLNQQHRQKNYATDVLSFDSFDPDSLGELVLCPEVLIRQAKEHNQTYRDELAYMVIHGVLHLLGMDHENSKEEEKKMLKIQDNIFEKFLAL